MSQGNIFSPAPLTEKIRFYDISMKRFWHKCKVWILIGLIIANRLQHHSANHVLTFVTKGYFFLTGGRGGLNQISRMRVHLFNRPVSPLSGWADTLKITASREVLNF